MQKIGRFTLSRIFFCKLIFSRLSNFVFNNTRKLVLKQPTKFNYLLNDIDLRRARRNIRSHHKYCLWSETIEEKIQSGDNIYNIFLSHLNPLCLSMRTITVVWFNYQCISKNKMCYSVLCFIFCALYIVVCPFRSFLIWSW